MRFLRSILDALLPPHDDARIAAAITATDLATLAAPRTVRGTFAVFPYQDRRIRAMVRAIKYYGETGVLEPLGAVAAEHLVALLDDEGLEKRKTLLCPIPSSPARLRKRGYNQAERIARAIHAHLPADSTIEYVPNLLAREDRETQVHAHKSRADNIRGAFYVPSGTSIYDSVRGSRIILIDDVIKTGATIRDATRALKAAGAKSVIAFAIAH
jgi:predicted amidophosphoribosyltransferase